MYLIYNLLLLFLLIILLPYYYFKNLSSGDNLGIKERFAFYTEQQKDLFPAEQVIWIQAASAGETLAAEQLTAAIRDQYPAAKIIFSTLTASGKSLAEKKISTADLIIYLPFDLDFIVRRAVKLFQPDLFIMIETELWPNLIKNLAANDCKLILASGRISDDSFDNYKLLAPLVAKTLTKVDVFSMQNQETAGRIAELGAPLSHICINGNLKYDLGLSSPTTAEIAVEFKRLGLKAASQLIVAGSTHQGEEKIILAVYKKLAAEFSQLKLLLAPRYVERREELLQLCSDYGLRAELYSKLKKKAIPIDQRQSNQVIIIDTMGELARLYYYAELVFVGGSLIKRGGHNIIEAAALGRVVLFGNSMYNFKEERDFLLAEKAAFEVSNQADFYQTAFNLLADDNYRQQTAELAKKVIAKNRGSVARHLKLIEVLLEQGVDDNAE